MNSEVLIIGAGPTGLTLAIELVRSGIAVRIVDKSRPRPKYESRAIGIHARTMEIFNSLGVLDEMLANGLKWHGFNFHAGGKQVGRLTFDKIDSKYNFALILPQSETERILHEKLQNCGVSVEYETELTALKQTENGVIATLTNKNGQTEQVKTTFLVGCDGAKSATRKLLKLDFIGKQLQGSYLADCEIYWEQESLTEGNTFLEKGWRLIIGQLPENRYRVVVNMPDNDVRMRNAAPTLTLIQKFVDEFGLKMRLHKMTWASAFYLSARRAEKMRVGRVFLAGDAAHNVCPNAGQGMNAGIHDAVNLAGKLTLFCHNKVNGRLLDDYEKERLPVIKKLLVASERIENLMTLENGFAAGLRNLALPFVTNSQYLQKKIGNQTAGLRN
jgi:2-polyprenyl-6-methoxyphenol hydroxylase-like FAD-dependent oxidoreductase